MSLLDFYFLIVSVDLPPEVYLYLDLKDFFAKCFSVFFYGPYPSELEVSKILSLEIS